MDLYGIYGTHATEACPLFNKVNRKLLLESVAGFEATSKKYGVKLIAAYHSGLEHTFVWIVESENAHSIQDLMVESKVANWNTTKIVPLRTLENVLEYCQGLD